MKHPQDMTRVELRESLNAHMAGLKVAREALEEVRSISADRESFVMLGAMSFATAERVTTFALAEIDRLMGEKG